MKYIHCYKYVKYDQGSLKRLTEGTLKYTSPLDFNDPFDCRPYYTKADVEDIKKSKSKLIKRIADTRKLSPAKRIQSKHKIAAELRSFIGTEKHLTGLLSKVGVLCLAKDPTQILMWSHYAEYHTGFVVEFKIPIEGPRSEADEPAYNLLPTDVVYQTERPNIVYGKDTVDESMEKSLLIKSDIWKYEDESKVIDLFRGAGIHPYNRERTLNSVITGINIIPKNMTEIESIVRDLSSDKSFSYLKLHRAVPCERHYRIKIPTHELWSDL